MNKKKDYSADCTDLNVLIVPVHNQPIVQPSYVQEEKRCGKPVKVRGSFPEIKNTL